MPLTEGEEDDVDIGLEPLSSPLREVVSESAPRGKIVAAFASETESRSVRSRHLPMGPIIKDAQCNPWR